MFERFTDVARKIMAMANLEAQRRNHEYIGTEHILLAMIRHRENEACLVFTRHDLALIKIQNEVDKLVPNGPEMVTMGKLPQTPRAKKVIEYAIEEARNLNHNWVGPEHLLVGLFREHDGVAAQVLLNLGMRLENTREDVLDVIALEKKAASWPESATKKTEKIRTETTVSVARKFKHDLQQLPHLLVTVLCHSDLGLEILNRSGREPALVYKVVRELLPEGNTKIGEKLIIPEHLDVQNLFKIGSCAEANKLKHRHIGIEHILLALNELNEGLVPEIFEKLSMSKSFVRSQVLIVIGERDPVFKPEPTNPESTHTIPITLQDVNDRKAAQPVPNWGLPFWSRIATSNARKLMEAAKQEAQRLKHDLIGTEHILLGLVKACYAASIPPKPRCIAATVLHHLEVDPRRVRLEVEKLIEVGPISTSDLNPVSLTTQAKRVMRLAYETAEELGHEYIGTEHILIALAKEGSGLATHVLTNKTALGLSAGVIQEKVVETLKIGEVVPSIIPFGNLGQEETEEFSISKAIPLALKCIENAQSAFKTDDPNAANQSLAHTNLGILSLLTAIATTLPIKNRTAEVAS